MHQRMTCFVLCVVLIAAASEVSQAISTTWYNTLGNRSWQELLNWDYGVPGSADRAYISMDSINCPIISTGIAASAQRVYLGRTAAGSLDVTGGSLTVSDIMYIGNSGYNGTLNISSGTINVNNRLEIGYTSSRGFLNMTGGLIKAKYVDLPYTGGLASHLQLDGGTLICENTFTVNSGGTGDITDGQLQLNGNITSLAGFSGWGVSGALIFTYNVSLGKTTVTADPNFSPVATQPEPVNNETGVSPYEVLSWWSGYSAVQHDVYFGTSWDDVNSADTSTVGIYKGRQNENTYDAGQLESLQLGVTYYWRIDEVNGVNIWTGRIWKFSTDDGCARQPLPADNSVGVDILTDSFRWTPGPFAQSQDFYFGNSFADVNDRQTPDINNLSANTGVCSIPAQFLPLNHNRTYYWRVDTNNGPLSVSKGKIWNFKTAPYNDITFFSISDSHYEATDGENTAKIAAVNRMNTLPGIAYPGDVEAGTVQRPRGVLALGDLIDDGANNTLGPQQWAKWKVDFGVNGEGTLNFPVYEGFGNHDLNASKFVQNDIKARTLIRPGVSNVSPNGLHYSWDWDDVHFIQLNLYPGNEPNSTPYSPIHDPEYALDFLIADLAENVGTTGRPVVIMHHFDPRDTWWYDWAKTLYYNAIKNYNVICIIHGHTGTGIYNWNGIDVVNDGNLGASIFVFHITQNRLISVRYDVAGKAWASLNLKKTIWIPSFCDYDDLISFTSQWLQEGDGIEADLNADKKVDFADFRIFASRWFQYCPQNWPW